MDRIKNIESIDPECTFDDERTGEIEKNQPFDTKAISIEKKPIVIEACVRRLLQGTIELSPSFQRHEVWDALKKSRLIESLMLKIPIPMFYVSADQRGNLTVVDGLQRLSAIRDFILGREFLETKDPSLRGNGMKLKNLEFWTEYNGATFNELPIFLQNRILETELTFTIINPGTPEDVKFNIFKRINTGGVMLNAQEIRNALYSGVSTNLLLELSDSSEFKDATQNSIKSVRMSDMEILLRAIAFIVRDYTNYPKSGDMDQYLSDTMIILNSMPSYQTNEMAKLRKVFPDIDNAINKYDTNELVTRVKRGLIRAHDLFGRHAFRRSYGDMNLKPINKSLFEIWVSELSKLSDVEYKTIREKKKPFISDYIVILDSQAFQDKISRDSWQYNSLQSRFEEIHKLIKYHA